MRTYMEPSKGIPVVDEVDVLVAGGGPAGIGAAVAAARTGAKVLLIEEQNCLGGMATSGMMSHFTGSKDSPLFNEISRRCRDRKWPCEDLDAVGPNTINHEKLKLVLFDMMDESGARYQLHTKVSDVIMEGDVVRGVITESKSGREAVMAKVVVDCTGDGDVAFKAGAAFIKGREKDGKMQPVTLMFKIGGVDRSRAVYPGSFETLVETPKGELQALARKILPAPAGHVLLYKSTIPDQVVVNMTNLTGIDGSDIRDLTKAETVCQRQIPAIIKFLQEYVPGYEKCYLIAAAANVGVRETRHFKGLYTMNETDIVEAKVFDDWIATRNFFNFDIHNIEGSGLDANGAQHKFKARGDYTIPYRSCVPEKIDGLLLSGRNISGTHKAHSNFRVMSICLNIGHGTGVAAAIAARKNVQPRKVDVKEVQEILRKQGMQV